MARTKQIPEDRQRTAIVAARITPAFKLRMQSAADAEGRSVSDWLMRLAEDALKEEGARK